MTQLKTFAFNHFSENTYVVYDESKECIIIDPGCYFEEETKSLFDFIENNGLQVQKTIFTHCHIDHILGAKAVKEQFPGIKFEAHQEEEMFIKDAALHAQRFHIKAETPPNLDKFINNGEIIKFGKTKLKALHVPGHSKGSLCYYCEKENFLISGDVLFLGSVGRTDLPGGNYDSLIHSIKSNLLTLPENCVVHCGHGSTTTIGNEKLTNPFLT